LIQAVKQSWKAAGARWRNRSRKVSWEGIPWGRRRPSARSQASLERPKAARSSKLLAPDRVAHKAMVRRSPNGWVTKRGARGSCTAAKGWRISSRSITHIGASSEWSLGSDKLPKRRGKDNQTKRLRQTRRLAGTHATLCPNPGY